MVVHGENHEKIKELPGDGIMENLWDRIMEIAGNGSEEIKEDLAISVS